MKHKDYFGVKILLERALNESSPIPSSFTNSKNTTEDKVDNMKQGLLTSVQKSYVTDELLLE